MRLAPVTWPFRMMLTRRTVAPGVDALPLIKQRIPTSVDDKRGGECLSHVTRCVLGRVHKQSESRRRQAGPSNFALHQQCVAGCFADLKKCAIQCGVRLSYRRTERAKLCCLGADAGQLLVRQALTARVRE